MTNVIAWRHSPDPCRCTGCGIAESTCLVGRMLGEDRCCSRCTDTAGESHDTSASPRRRRKGSRR